jgi:hypothetical protein
MMPYFETDCKFDEDAYLRDRLKEIDESASVEVTSWESHFLENVLYIWTGRLTDAQRKTARCMIDKYLMTGRTEKRRFGGFPGEPNQSNKGS